MDGARDGERGGGVGGVHVGDDGRKDDARLGNGVEVGALYRHHRATSVRQASRQRHTRTNLLTIGPKIYAARMSRGSSSYRSISAARARPQQQTRRPLLLLSIDGTDGRTDGNIEIKRQRIRRKDEHVARDDSLTGRLRSRNKYPTVRARTNRFKNSYISYATTNYQ